MATSCARVLRMACPRFLLASRSSCLTAPAICPKKYPLHHQRHRFCSSVPRPKKETDGDRIEAKASVGETLLEVAINNDVELEGICVFCKQVSITFVMNDGEKVEAKAKVGDNLLDVVIENDIDIDGFGACEGTLACSTCHLIFKPKEYNQLPEPPTDEELDMLDLAFDLQDTSRLGCQIIVTKGMEGWEVKVPAGVADAREPS
ncbi:hypothetical protein BaRGS_00005483 [Batillaria attramentaria]|uniref:2Fe-2S ferredoxin-type domain-containing protein n=1 Tax=Batillaria attramentaria TaxID=370345 RepID=A0ABD0LVI7_9CAEN